MGRGTVSTFKKRLQVARCEFRRRIVQRSRWGCGIAWWPGESGERYVEDTALSPQKKAESDSKPTKWCGQPHAGAASFRILEVRHADELE